MIKNRIVRIFSAALAFVLALGSATKGAESASVGSTAALTGQVSNAATKDYLEGAMVELAGTSRHAVTDREGRYTFSDVAPTNNAVLVVSFSGLDTQRIALALSAGRKVVRDVELISDVYRLDKFVVAGEREGMSKAQMLQRQAPNVKNVVSADSFGNWADANIAAVLEMVPGVAVGWNDTEARNANIRGVGGTVVTMDGQSLASDTLGRTNREYHFDSTSVGNIDRIELTKAATPDMEAASVGGSINLVTKSAFDRVAGRVITYAAGFTHQPTYRAHGGFKEPFFAGYGPFFNLSYSDVLGKDRNLAVAFTGNYSNYQSNFSRSLKVFGQNNPNPGPTFVSNHTRRAAFSNRTKSQWGAKFDHRWSEQTIVSLGMMYNWAHFTAGMSQSVLNSPSTLATIDANGNRTGGGAISPNFADGITRVFPAAANVMNTLTVSANTGGESGAVANVFVIRPSVRHRFKTLDISYGLSYSSAVSKRDTSLDPGGSVTLRTAAPIGFNIDRSKDSDWPTVTQTAGACMYDLNNYSGLQYDFTNQKPVSRILNARLDVKKDLPWTLRTFIKTGLSYNRTFRKLENLSTERYTYKGPDGIAGTADDNRDLAQFLNTEAPWLTHPDYLMHFKQPGGLLPFPDIFAVARHVRARPDLWQENAAFGLQTTLQSRKHVTETISAAYLMANVQLGKVSLLTGLRVIETEDKGQGSLNYISPEERTRRAAWMGVVTDAESVRRIQAQFGDIQKQEGKYSSACPSAHLKFEPFQRLITRASWSVGITRPDFGVIMPNNTVNDDTQRVTASNPSIRPQYAHSYDLTAEYYFKSQGMIAVGAFRKDIKDFIYTDTSQVIGSGEDNGFGGEYEGYALTTSANRGRATVEGIEYSYQQQLTFLPGWAKGFGVSLSYTKLKTHGDYGVAGGDFTKAANAVAPTFQPESGAAGLSFRNVRWDLRLAAVYRGEMLLNGNPNPALLQYRRGRTMLNWKSKFNVSRALSLFVDIDNLNSALNSDTYLLYPDRNANYAKFDPKFQAGIAGRF